MLKRCDQLIVGGGIANTFIAATGHEVGKSLYEPELVPEAQRLIRLAHELGGNIPIPKDVKVAKTFSAGCGGDCAPPGRGSARMK